MKALRVAGLVVVALVGALALTVALLYVLFDGDTIKSEISRAVLEQKQRTLVISGQPQLSLWPDVGIRLEGVTLSERGSAEQFAALKSARISVAVWPLLRKRVQVRALDVQGLQATVVQKKDGTLNVADLIGVPGSPESKPSPTTASPAEALQFDVAGVHIADAQLVWRDESTGRTTQLSNLSLATGAMRADTGSRTASVEQLALAVKGRSGDDDFALTLEAPKLVLNPERSEGAAVTLAATLQGPVRKAAVSLVLNGVEGNADAVKVSGMAFKLDAAAGAATVLAQLDSPVAVNLAAKRVTLSKLAGNLRLSHPSMPMKTVTLPLAGSLEVDAPQQSAALTLSTQFDQSKIGTEVKVHRFSPLNLAFDLDVDQLDLDRYLPPTSPAATPVDASGPEARIDLGAMRGLIVNGSVRIGSLLAARLRLEQLNAKLALAGGRLEVSPLTMNLYQGSANGSLSVNAQGNAIALRQTLTGVSIHPLMRDLLNKDLLEGRGSVLLDLNTRGDTVGAMKKALAGSASLALKDGALKGINLAQTLRDVRAKLGQGNASQQANASQKTDFSELTASFKIANGVAHNDDLVLKSPFIRLSGAGDVNVGLGQMNYLARATLVASGEGQGGKEASQLKGLTVPVRVSGPFDALRYQPELGAMLDDAAKAKVEEKKQEIKAQAEEAVRDKAKDLFKGLLGK